MDDIKYFTCLYYAQYETLKRLAYLVLRGAGDRLQRAALEDEIVQKTFFNALVRIHSVRAAPVPWLIVKQKHIMRKLIVRELRKQPASASPTYWKAASGLLFLLPDYWSELDERVLSLKDDKGYSFGGISISLHLSLMYCIKRYEQLNQKLRTFLGKEKHEQKTGGEI